MTKVDVCFKPEAWKCRKSMSHPNDPALRSFVPVDPASDFPIQNLPYGVFSSARWSCAAHRRRDRRLCARSLGARAGWPAGCRRAGTFAVPSLNAFMALGAKGLVADTGADQRTCCVTTIDELRDNDELRKLALVPMAQAQAASADRGCRLHRFLFVEGARHQCRRHVPRQGQCRCSRTGCICRSAITAAPRRSWSVGTQGAAPARPIEAAECGTCRASDPASGSISNSKWASVIGQRVADGRDADRSAGRGDDLRLCAAERLERARHPAMGICAARAVPGQGVRDLDQPVGRDLARRWSRFGVHGPGAGSRSRWLISRRRSRTITILQLEVGLRAAAMNEAARHLPDQFQIHVLVVGAAIGASRFFRLRDEYRRYPGQRHHHRPGEKPARQPA